MSFSHIRYDKPMRERAKADGKGLFTISVDDRGAAHPVIGAITTQGPADAEECKRLADMILEFQEWRRARKVKR